MPDLPPYLRSKAAHLRFGRRGERIAKRLLRELGMQIICCNYTAPRGEIDIIALDGEVLCFVEVKARKPSLTSRPADAVTVRKRWSIVQTAHHYLAQLDHPRLPYRFDIVEVVMTDWTLKELRHWPNAFVDKEIYEAMRHRRPDLNAWVVPQLEEHA